MVNDLREAFHIPLSDWKLADIVPGATSSVIVYKFLAQVRLLCVFGIVQWLCSDLRNAIKVAYV